MENILKLLEKDARYTSEQIATMLGMDEKEVKDKIAAYEAEHIILGYSAMIDWDKTKEERVTALIEVKIAPQRDGGFDKIAERIYQYEEVESVYLMSGAFDLTVILSGRTFKEVALFVSARLATIEGVTSTATHFILKRYKDKNHMFTVLPEQQERLLYL